MLDLRIAVATIIDGTAACEPFRGGVGIIGDRMAEVGCIRSPAHRRIDADGLTLTPASSTSTSIMTAWFRRPRSRSSGAGTRAGRRLPIERLVHGLSRANATHVGWGDRGVIEPCMLADVNLGDVDRRELAAPVLVRDLPASGSRFVHQARGYAHTVKSGTVTHENGVRTGATPGRLRRG